MKHASVAKEVFLFFRFRGLRIDNLNRVTQKYNIDCVKWNIVKNDFLKSFISEKFDFIIGNHLYITYSDLNKITRTFIV